MTPGLPDKEEEMGRKLYVGNMTWETGEDELKLAFAQCGTVVEAKIVVDRESGRSRGFGFVTMGTDQEAQAAVRRWSGEKLDGRPLTVNEAVDKPRGEHRGPPRQAEAGGYSRGTYVTDAPQNRDGGGRERGRRGRDRDYG